VKKLRFDITYERDRHTYKQTDTHTPHDGIGRACKASRGKNRKHICDFLLTKNTNYGRRIRRSGWADIFILLIFIYLFSSDRDLGDAALYTFVTSLQDDYDVVKSDNDTLNRGVIQKVLTNTSFFGRIESGPVICGMQCVSLISQPSVSQRYELERHTSYTVESGQRKPSRPTWCCVVVC